MRSKPGDEQARSAILGTALTDIEGDYFFDYAVFGGALRTYVASALEAHYRREPNEMHPRAFLLALYREEHTAYEDLGAFLDAMLLASVDPQVIPLERILDYGPGEVHLKKVLGKHSVTSGDDLFAKDGVENQRQQGLRAFNKIKRPGSRSRGASISDCASQRTSGDLQDRQEEP